MYTISKTKILYILPSSPMKKSLLKFLPGLLTVLAVLWTAQAFASSADMDPSFNTGIPIGFDNYPTAIAAQADGKIVVVGGFVGYQGKTAGNLVRLNKDGSRDTKFNIGSWLDHVATSLAIQPDGKILIGGWFSSYQWVAANRLLRLNKDGSRDTSFDGQGSNSFYGITNILVQTNGKIIIMGDFTTYDGQPANKIVRLNCDGKRDYSFDIWAGFNGYISGIKQATGGKLIAWWYFTSFSGDSANRIIRLNADGSRDTSFAMGDWFNNSVSSVLLQADWKILVVGSFATYNGQSVGKIVRINQDGSLDTGFDGSTFWSYYGSLQYNSIQSLFLQTDWKIVIWGQTSVNNWVTWQFVFLRLNTDGSTDTNFDVWSGFDAGIIASLTQIDGKIIFVGQFTKYRGDYVNRIIRLNADRTRDTSFSLGNGLDSSVVSTSIQSDGKIIVAGGASSYRGLPTNGLMRLNKDGSRDNTLNIWAGFDVYPSTTAIQSNGKIIVWGGFNTYDGDTANKVIRLNADGSRDTSFDVGTGMDSLNVSSVKIQPDGKILTLWVWARTDWYWTSTQLHRFNSDGTLDTGFTFNNAIFANIPVYYITLQPDGKIICVWNQQGQRQNIWRLNTDGSTDNSFSTTSVNNHIAAVGVQADGKIVVGGQFQECAGVSTIVKNGVYSNVRNICRVNADGAFDTGFDMASGFDYDVAAIAPQMDGKILIGGKFAFYKWATANNIIRLNADGTRDASFNVWLWFGAATFYGQQVSSITIQPDGEILVGGNFTNYKKGIAGYLIKLYGDAPVVDLPNTKDTSTVNTAFTSQGYTENSGALVGSTPISLDGTDGSIPISLDCTNQNLNISIPEDTQVKESDNTTNYNGIISVPVNKEVSTVNNQPVITAFNVGSNSNIITLAGWSATLSIPVIGQTIGDDIQVYYSDDNGVTWYPETTAQIISYNWDPYVQFTTEHLGDFAITKLGDNVAPVITLVGNASVNIAQGASYTDAGATASDNIDGNISSYIIVNNSVDTANTGTYTVTYDVYDDAGNTATQVIRTVHVTDGSDTTSDNTSNNTSTSSSSHSSHGGAMVSKDICPESRDCSDSYYDSLCGKCSLLTTISQTLFHGSANNGTGDIAGSTYSTELNNAYLRAYKYNITTMPSVQRANITDSLVRKDMAKMISNFAINVLGKNVSTGSTSCSFSDISSLSKDTQYYIVTSCRLGLMGLESDGITVKKTFDPSAVIDRGQFGTVLSRLIRTGKYNGGNPYYTKHLNALKANKIMTKIDTPSQDEIRGYVMLMMMRAAQ